MKIRLCRSRGYWIAVLTDHENGVSEIERHTNLAECVPVKTVIAAMRKKCPDAERISARTTGEGD